MTVPVQSKPLPSAQPAETKEALSAPRRPNSWAPGVALLVFGALLWLAGAKYTLIGWIAGLNWFLAWLALPARVPPVVGWWILLSLPIGLIYSQVELRRPWRYRANSWDRVLLYGMIWVIIVVTDGGSTFLGVKEPDPNAWTIQQQLAASDLLAVIWAILLTFVPEWFIIGGLALLRR